MRMYVASSCCWAGLTGDGLLGWKAMMLQTGR